MGTNVARVRHRVIIASCLRHWYSVQLARCSEDAEAMLRRVEAMELPSDAAALRYSFPIAGFRVRSH